MNTLKVGMLNCQGIKGKFETPEFQNLVKSHDIFGVCETWLGKKEPIKVSGFNFYPLNRKKVKGVTKGGLGVFIRQEIKVNVAVRYDISSEIVLWCKIKKEFLNTTEDMFVGLTYIPPEYSSREKRLKLDHFTDLKERTSALPNNKFIVVGDFNARTGNKEDILEADKHENVETTQFFSQIKTKRTNQDTKVNKYGNHLLDFCAATHTYIANGRTLGDLLGKLTCHEPRGSSTVDYAVIHESLKKSVKSFRVFPPSLSDHCPIKLELSYQKGQGTVKVNYPKLKPSIKWNEKTKEIFMWHINSPEAEKQIEELEKIMDDPLDNIEVATEKLQKLYTHSLKIKGGKKPAHKSIKPKKWYDKSCAEMSKHLKLTGYLLSKSPKDP